jgi:hypothetical protein
MQSDTAATWIGSPTSFRCNTVAFLKQFGEKDPIRLSGFNSPKEEVTGMGKDNIEQTGTSNTVKDPDEWTTGDEQMTGAQRSYLKTLSDEAGEEFDESLTKAEASKRIDELQQKTGRGLEHEGQAGAGR